MNENPTRNLAKGLILLGLLTVALGVLSGCANKTPGQPLQVSSSSYDAKSADDMVAGNRTDDMFEPVNRAIFKFNDIIDGLIIRPAAHIYLGLMPECGQHMVKNILTNLNAPVVFLNSVLQNDPTNAGHTFTRFLVNSTVGIAGAFDVASKMGIQKEHRKDFGQTMGVYGITPGPYIVLPLIGPSDLRDTVGYAADIFSDPFNYIFTTDEALARAMVQGLVRRADYLPLTKRVYRDSFDPYATFRSIYLQNRHRVIRDYLGSDSDVQKYSGK